MGSVTGAAWYVGSSTDTAYDVAPVTDPTLKCGFCVRTRIGVERVTDATHRCGFCTRSRMYVGSVMKPTLHAVLAVKCTTCGDDGVAAALQDWWWLLV